jgi:hypothetical protein
MMHLGAQSAWWQLLPDAFQTSNRQSLLSVQLTQCSPWLGNAGHWCLTMTLGLPYNGEQRTTVSSRVAIPWTASLHIVCEQAAPWL